MIGELLLFYAVMVLSRLLWLLPFRWALRIGAGLGSMAYHLRVRRRVVESNLELAFPDRTPRERARIARDAYRETGMSMTELLRSPSDPPVDQSLRVELEGKEHLDRALAKGRGVMLVAGHFGSWDAAGAAMPRYYTNMHLVMRRQRNLMMDALYDRIYRLRGYHTIPKREAVPQGYAALASGGILVLLGDQDARSRGVFVPFFGRLASTPKGPALFAYRSGALLVFTRIERQEDPVRRKLIFEPAVEADTTAPEDREVERLTALFNQSLEASIRERPDHYFWFHKRWKTPAPAPIIETP